MLEFYCEESLLLALFRSLFDLDAYGDEDYGCDGSDHRGGVAAAAAAAAAGSPCASTAAGGRQQSHMSRRDEKPEGGKLEMSYLNFRKAHPNYEGNAAGNSMFNRISTFKDAQ